jgi:hypothetical protein
MASFELEPELFAFIDDDHDGLFLVGGEMR